MFYSPNAIRTLYQELMLKMILLSIRLIRQILNGQKCNSIKNYGINSRPFQSIVNQYKLKYQSKCKIERYNRIRYKLAVF